MNNTGTEYDLGPDLTDSEYDIDTVYEGSELTMTDLISPKTSTKTKTGEIAAIMAFVTEEPVNRGRVDDTVSGVYLRSRDVVFVESIYGRCGNIITRDKINKLHGYLAGLKERIEAFRESLRKLWHRGLDDSVWMVIELEEEKINETAERLDALILQLIAIQKGGKEPSRPFEFGDMMDYLHFRRPLWIDEYTDCLRKCYDAPSLVPAPLRRSLIPQVTGRHYV